MLNILIPKADAIFVDVDSAMAATEAAITDMVARRFEPNALLPTETHPDTLTLIREKDGWKMRMYWDVSKLFKAANEYLDQGRLGDALMKYGDAARIGRLSIQQKNQYEAIKYAVAHITIADSEIEEPFSETDEPFSGTRAFRANVTNSGTRNIKYLTTNVLFENHEGRLLGSELYIFSDIGPGETKTEESVLVSAPASWKDGHRVSVINVTFK